MGENWKKKFPTKKKKKKPETKSVRPAASASAHCRAEPRKAAGGGAFPSPLCDQSRETEPNIPRAWAAQGLALGWAGLKAPAGRSEHSSTRWPFLEHVPILENMEQR